MTITMEEISGLDKEYRIIEQGQKFVIQRKGFFRWRDLVLDGGAWNPCGYRQVFNTREEAEKARQTMGDVL